MLLWLPVATQEIRREDAFVWWPAPPGLNAESQPMCVRLWVRFRFPDHDRHPLLRISVKSVSPQLQIHCHRREEDHHVALGLKAELPRWQTRMHEENVYEMVVPTIHHSQSACPVCQPSSARF